MAEHPSFQSPFIPPGEPVPGKTYRADGWAYIDPPTRFSPEAWDGLMDLIGGERRGARRHDRDTPGRPTLRARPAPDQPGRDPEHRGETGPAGTGARLIARRRYLGDIGPADIPIAVVAQW